MSVKPSAFSMLSAIENEKCNHLSACLAKLERERKRLESDLEAAQSRRREADAQQRLSIGKSVKASELAIWKTADRELKTQMDGIVSRLSELHREESSLRTSLAAHIGKHHTWETLLDNESEQKKRLAVKFDQRAVDDQTAHRPRRPA